MHQTNKRNWLVVIALPIGIVIAVIGYAIYPKKTIDPTVFDAPIWSCENPDSQVTLMHKNGSQVTYTLGVLTQLHATEAWNDCIYAFWTDRDWLGGKAWKQNATENEPFSEPWLVDAPDEINSIRRDGWKACSERLSNLCSIFSEREVRKAIRKRYLTSRDEL